MTSFPGTPCVADMHVHIQLGRPKHAVPAFTYSEAVSSGDKSVEIGGLVFYISHADLNVDDGLGGQSHHRRRTNVIDTPSDRTEGLADAPSVFLEAANPGFSIRLNGDRPLLGTANEFDFIHPRSLVDRAVLREYG